MSIEKTLGGDRLGSGKKMKVELHNYERSTHDLSYVWRSTMSAGTLVPFLTEVALPGDTFDIDLECAMMTNPTIGPLFGSYKVQLDIFQAPIRLYNSLLHNNMLGIGMNISKVKFPQIRMEGNPIHLIANKNNAQINPSSLLSYLGLRGVGYCNEYTYRSFNAIPILAYWEIYKNYYANKQEQIGAVIHANLGAQSGTISGITVFDAKANPTSWSLLQAPNISQMNDLSDEARITITKTGTVSLDRLMINLSGHGLIPANQFLKDYVVTATAINGTYDFNRWGYTYAVNWQWYNLETPLTVEPEVTTFPLDNIDDMRKAILSYQSETVPFSINEDVQLEPYSYLTQRDNGIPTVMASQEGLGVKTYQSDLFNNWLETDWIGAISTASAVSTVGNTFTIDQLQLANKVYEMLNRIAVSGGSYDDWLDAVYTHERIKRAESPIYHGGLIKELVFEEVISTAATSTQDLGTLAGKGRLSQKHKGGKVIVKVDEPSYIIGIISLTPRVDYSQGNKWDVNLETMNDLHKPALDEIGFQDLITEQMAYWDTYYDGTKWVQRSAGKQPAWINYMTNYNRCYGNFAIETNQMFMTLNRRYEFNTANNSILDLTTYIDPKKFNFIFAQTALDAQNFWAQIGVNMIARRKMSAKIMPNL